MWCKQFCGRIISAVYEIKLKGSDDIRYVGSSINVYDRSAAHYSLLKNNKHHCRHLQNAVNLYGLANFEFNIISEYDRAVVLTKEDEILISDARLYNSKRRAVKGFCGKHKEESKIKSGLNNPNRQPVYLINLLGDIEGNYESCRDLARKFNLPVTSFYGSIRGACNYSEVLKKFIVPIKDYSSFRMWLNEQQLPYNYKVWNKGVKFTKEQTLKLGFLTPIKVTNTLTGEVEYFNYQREACLKYNIQPCSLNRCLKNKRIHRTTKLFFEYSLQV